MELGDAHVSVQATEGNTVGPLAGARQFFLQQFDGLADKDGYVMQPKDKNTDPQRQFVYGVFTQADKNGDGKLHRSEYAEWIDMMNVGSVAHVTVQVSDTGRSLFDLLDADRDGKLSIRELRQAWSRMEAVCEKKDEGLAQDRLPRSLRVTLAQGNVGGRNRFFFFNMNAQEVRVPKARSVPEWFTKLDRNNDGDVSLAEWLGSRESFDAIDTNKDGLISPEEARAFEARRNNKKKTDADGPKK
jgi:Ca2+-binding EF-hand superfamily protein